MLDSNIPGSLKYKTHEYDRPPGYSACSNALIVDEIAENRGIDRLYRCDDAYGLCSEVPQARAK